MGIRLQGHSPHPRNIRDGRVQKHGDVCARPEIVDSCVLIGVYFDGWFAGSCILRCAIKTLCGVAFFWSLLLVEGYGHDHNKHSLCTMQQHGHFDKELDNEG